MGSSSLPSVEHIYKNHTLDSTRWHHFVPRADDIVIATPIKSGTTWMQIIVMHLIFQDLQPRSMWNVSPWLDESWSGTPIEDILAHINSQSHRRFIKTHLPLDGLPYFDQVKYIVVGRDARDVFMSLWNFYGIIDDEMIEATKTQSPNNHFPPRPQDIRDFWRMWISSGWFEWESEGYPFWSNLRHTQTWWDFKHLPNILFVHYNDLLADLEGEIQRIAAFLEIEVSPTLCTQIAQASTFKQVQANAKKLLPDMGQSFFYKGTNGRWQSILNEEDLQLYHAAVARELNPDCAHWLENGRRGGR
jgi:aryl sulfotransferase